MSTNSTSELEHDLRPRARTLSWMASLSVAAGEMRAAEGYLLELLAWCAFADRSIIEVAGDGGEPVRLTHKSTNFVRVSPDGKMFAASYNAGAGERMQLAIFPIDGREPLYVFDIVPGANFNHGIRWTPDGKSLVYRDFGPSLWKQDLTGGEPTKILEFPDEVIYSFDWSPDGKHFAVAHGEDVRDVVMVTNER